jgi:hypothetical protein
MLESPTNSHGETLIPDVIVFKMGHWRGIWVKKVTQMMIFVPLKDEILESLIPLCPLSVCENTARR